MIITRSNQETLKWLRQIDWQKMSGKTLTDEAMCFFGELQTKRPNTVKSKLIEFLKKEDQLRKCVLFKIMRERGGEGPRGRSPPSNFELKDITFGGFIDEKNFSFQCNICGTTLPGRNESEKHLRTDHFESYKSLFAKECLLQTRDHPRYKEWEYQETLIQGFNLHNLNGREKLHKNKKDEVQNNEEDGNDQTFRIVKERISGSNIFEVEKSVISRKGGNLTNTIVKEVFAKVTTRQVKKRKEEKKTG